MNRLQFVLARLAIGCDSPDLQRAGSPPDGFRPGDGDGGPDPEGGSILYTDGRGGTIELEYILAPAGAWGEQPEASDPTWKPHHFGWVTLALRLRC